MESHPRKAQVNAAKSGAVLVQTELLVAAHQHGRVCADKFTRNVARFALIEWFDSVVDRPDVEVEAWARGFAYGIRKYHAAQTEQSL